MKRITASLVAVLLFVATSLPAQTVTGWNVIAQLLRKSTVFVQAGQSSCTGFVINDSAKDKKGNDVDLVLTAAHCDGAELYADQRPTTIRTKDVQKDLMVLEVEDLDRPALKLAKTNPAIGDEVASFGYGYGLERPVFRVAHISDDNIYIPFEGIGGPLIAIDASFVPGQSGGPVVNQSGEVVMIVQLGTPIVGFGVGAETIKDKVGKFFGAKK